MAAATIYSTGEWTLIVEDGRNPRRRRRRVDINSLIDRAIARAGERGVGMSCAHGGSVPNCYRYPALTDAVVVVALAAERVVVVRAYELPANKVSLGGAAARAWSESARPIWDGRYGDASEQEAKRQVIAEARAAAHGHLWPRRVAAALAEIGRIEADGGAYQALLEARSALERERHTVAELRRQVGEARADLLAEIREHHTPHEEPAPSRWAALEVA